MFIKKGFSMDKEYLKIIDNLANNRKFKKLINEKHHNSNNRYNHSLDVSYYTYKICKKLNLDYESATRAALLHDFFFKSEIRGPKEIIFHPKHAIVNASKITKLNDKEKNIILSHMFPIGYVLPKYKESIIVDIVDDVVSFKDIKNICQKNIRMLENALSFIAFVLINFIR